jgi:hypothetical protein
MQIQTSVLHYIKLCVNILWRVCMTKWKCEQIFFHLNYCSLESMKFNLLLCTVIIAKSTFFSFCRINIFSLERNEAHKSCWKILNSKNYYFISWPGTGDFKSALVVEKVVDRGRAPLKILGVATWDGCLKNNWPNLQLSRNQLDQKSDDIFYFKIFDLFCCKALTPNKKIILRNLSKLH